jgi:hypothetical protein
MILVQDLEQFTDPAIAACGPARRHLDEGGFAA